MWIFTDKKQSWYSEREVLSRLWSQSRAGERTGALAPRLPDTQEKPQVHMTSSFYSGVEYWVSCLSCCFLLFQSQKKVRSADIWSAKRLQENENRFVTCFSLIQKQRKSDGNARFTPTPFPGCLSTVCENERDGPPSLMSFDPNGLRAEMRLSNYMLFCDLFPAFLAPSVPMRGGGRGMRGMGRGRGNPRMNDIFRSRKQNTSRPPSMHVDDFMAMEHAKTQDSPPMRRPGPKVGEKTQNMQYL